MNILQVKNINKCLAIGLLFVFGLTFSHSELGQINYDEMKHLEHDFCKLIDNTAVQITKYSNVDLNKLSFIKDLQSSCGAIVFISRSTETSNYTQNRKQEINCNKDIYIQINSFLI
jgi:hypothetical protein